MTPKVLFDLFSPREDGAGSPPQIGTHTYMPNDKAPQTPEVVPPPPTAVSGIHIPPKK